MVDRLQTYAPVELVEDGTIQRGSSDYPITRILERRHNAGIATDVDPDYYMTLVNSCIVRDHNPYINVEKTNAFRKHETKVLRVPSHCTYRGTAYQLLEKFDEQGLVTIYFKPIS